MTALLIKTYCFINHIDLRLYHVLQVDSFLCSIKKFIVAPLFSVRKKKSGIAQAKTFSQLALCRNFSLVLSTEIFPMCPLPDLLS